MHDRGREDRERESVLEHQTDQFGQGECVSARICMGVYVMAALYPPEGLLTRH